jgi:hypothetical protein
MVESAMGFVDRMTDVEVALRVAVVLRVEVCHAVRVNYRQPSRWVGKRLEVQILCSRLAGCYAGSSQSYFPAAGIRLAWV